MIAAQHRRLLLLINDLMFVSGLRTQAEAAGWSVATARNQAKLEQVLKPGNSDGAIDHDWDLVLVDLDARAQYLFDSKSEILGSLLSRPHIAFYSHMDQEAFQAGTQLGFTKILPRSKLSDSVTKLLTPSAQC